MKVEKGNPGYISGRKKVDAIWLLAFVLLGVVIFLIGYFVTHTRANIFTVMAVLLVLPGAKRIVALFVMLPRKSVSHERYGKISDVMGEGTLYADYVFTSTEKIMHLDFLLVKNGNVLAVVAPSKQDVAYMKKYLTDCIHKVASDVHVKFFDTDEELLKQLERLTQVATEPKKEEALLEFLYASIV